MDFNTFIRKFYIKLEVKKNTEEQKFKILISRFLRISLLNKQGF